MRANLGALLFLITAAQLACASKAATYVSVTVEELVANPSAWDGHLVEVKGLAVSEFENFGLYGSYDEYCPRGTWKKAIYVPWGEVKGFRPGDNRHLVVIRGKFTNINGVEHHNADGSADLIISTGLLGLDLSRMWSLSPGFRQFSQHVVALALTDLGKAFFGHRLRRRRA